MELTLGIFKELNLNIFDSKYETLVIAKPLCGPSRPHIQEIFNAYGVKLYGYKEWCHIVDWKGEKVEACYLAKMKLSKKQIVWAEYLLLRSHKFFLWDKPKHPKNEAWATKHNVMPQSWNGKPLKEVGCSMKGLKKNDKTRK